MTINNIHNKSYSDKEINKSHQPGSTGTPQAGSASGPRSKGKPSGDNLRLSGSRFNGDFDFARNELAKLGGGSLSMLRKIKSKIDSGAYNSEEVHHKISSLIEKDLASIETILTSVSAEETPPADAKLTEEYTTYLVENPDVIRKVADGLARDFKSL